MTTLHHIEIREMKLNLGSGPEKGTNGWINIDLEPGADLAVDLTKGIPFSDKSITQIYTSHFLEHLTYEQINPILSECLRVLIPNGSLSICVPDSEAFFQAYINNAYTSSQLDNGSFLTTPTFLNHAGERVYAKALVNTGSKIDWINYIAYSAGEHKYMFDRENLINHLKQTGFTDIKEREYCPELDKHYGKHASLFYVASKNPNS